MEGYKPNESQASSKSKEFYWLSPPLFHTYFQSAHLFYFIVVIR